MSEHSPATDHGLDSKRRWRERIACLPTVQHFQWLPETGSTNDVVRQWLIAEKPAGRERFLCVADRQSAGRGRGEHAWWSPVGCLMFSWSYRSTREASTHRSTLALVVGLAIAKVLEQHSRVPPMIKWPNDLYVEGRKIGGILIETVGLDQCIIGIGVNVQVAFEQASLDLQHRATSLHEWCDRIPCCEQLLWELLESIQDEIQRWEQDACLWHPQWQRYCLLKGRRLEVAQPGRTWTGICQGVAADGRLQVLDESGTVHALATAAIHLFESP